MLVQGWVNIVDVGPVLNQHYVTCRICWDYISANRRRWIDVGLMLSQCKRRWSNIKSAMSKLLRNNNKEGTYISEPVWLNGRGPRVVLSTAAFHARIRGSFPGPSGLKEAKSFLPHPLINLSIAGSLRDRDVACSASTSRVWISNPVSGGQCHLTHLTILRRFSWPSLACMYTKKPDSFHFIFARFKQRLFIKISERVRTPFWPSSFKETKCFFPAYS